MESDHGEENLVPLHQIYHKFLIGTEKCDKLELVDLNQLQTLAQVARTYPDSLRQLRVVHNGSYMSKALAAAEPEFIDDLLGMYFKVRLYIYA